MCLKVLCFWKVVVFAQKYRLLIKELLDQRICLIKQSRLFYQTIDWSTCLINKHVIQTIVLSDNLDCLIKKMVDQPIAWSKKSRLFDQQKCWSNNWLIKQSRYFDQTICWSNNCLINNLLIKQLFDQTFKVVSSTNMLIKQLVDQTI